MPWTLIKHLSEAPDEDEDDLLSFLIDLAAVGGLLLHLLELPTRLTRLMADRRFFNGDRWPPEVDVVEVEFVEWLVVSFSVDGAEIGLEPSDDGPLEEDIELWSLGTYWGKGKRLQSNDVMVDSSHKVSSM